MSISRLSQIWIAHASMMIRSFTLVVIAAVSRGKLLKYYAKGHDVLNNENVGVLLLSSVEFFCALVTGCGMFRYVMNNNRLKCGLLSFLTALLSAQCFLLIDIVCRTKQTLSKEDEEVNLLTVTLCGLGIFLLTTTFQLSIYLYMCIYSEVRRYNTVTQRSYQDMSGHAMSTWAIDKNYDARNGNTV